MSEKNRNWGEFENLNFALTMKFLVEFAISIENEWEDVDTRSKLLESYSEYLNKAISKFEELDSIRQLPQKLEKDILLKQFLSLIVPIERSYTRSLSDHQYLITTEDRIAKPRKTIPLTLVLENIRSSFNIGSIMRTAECLGVQKIYLCGYSSTPDDPKFGKVAMGAQEVLDWEWVPRAKDIISLRREKGDVIIGLETSKNSEELTKVKIAKPMTLVLGNERYGLEEDLLELCDHVLCIGMSGVKNSLNVAVAMGICTHYLREHYLKLSK
ncbi:MAG: TrmH family RNA methyltransferase [Bacteriovoracaceae bacterium]|nr:TrmH family RNA methyltransferase [Bacteriovoracaceae bacterium]